MKASVGYELNMKWNLQFLTVSDDFTQLKIYLENTFQILYKRCPKKRENILTFQYDLSFFFISCLYILTFFRCSAMFVTILAMDLEMMMMSESSFL